MITLLSPAKTLDYDSDVASELSSSPRFTEETASLIHDLTKLSVNDVAQLMKISASLAELNVKRYHDFDVAPTRQAIMTFNGHVYRDIDWQHYQKGEYEFAQQHLRILSGLYGLLRPLDLIKPYRLEMGTKLATNKGSSLYEFWGSKIAHLLQQDLATQGDDVVVNLASNEYSKSVLDQDLNATIITPIFKDWNEKSESYKIISVYAKIARGTMTNWIILNRINDLDGLTRFAEDGYTLQYQKEKLDKKRNRKLVELTFTRRI